NFAAPQPSGSGGNQAPAVSLTSPADGTNIVFSSAPASLPLVASASDSDGSIAKVEFYTGTTKLGEMTTSPYTLLWSGFGSGSYQLTAVATDNAGASTVSTPITISVAVPPPPAALRLAQLGTNFALYWPTSITALSLQWAADLTTPDWQEVTNSPVLSSNQYTLTLGSAGTQRFFRLGATVDPSTLTGKMLLGYQGWFACPGDGSPMNKWVHWFDSQIPVATNVTVDFWPDVSELDPDELFTTGMTLADGSPAMVYAAWNQKTVVRHFKWMEENHLDGVFLQRFTSELSNSKNFGWRNQVTRNVRAGAETYGRVFAIMYDISSQNPTTLVSTLTNDWAYLVNTMQITNSPRYIRHRGKPVVAVWGFGFTSRTNTPADAQAIISFFKAAGCTIMGGVPTYWRTLTSDSQTNAEWAAAYRSFDIISPWSVTRFNSLSGADSFKSNLIVPDRIDCLTHGIEYMPVLFPGFSWHNLYPTYALNQIPRLGGTFYWRQAYNAISAGCTMLYGAMFDELNEGTSMFKMAPTAAQLPAQGTFVPLNIDGQNLPNDWYLRLADQA
ncbi:MAG TPA: Ig-like domain-containing protein, partial [Candidatus Sulfotelmatobacter sp.]|nr:Ig-like domain-containing protein [Candidatus Sulfotelmatobacter sp.]